MINLILKTQGLKSQLEQYALIEQLHVNDEQNGVWLAKDLITDNFVAIKQIDLENYKKNQLSGYREHQLHNQCKESTLIIDLVDAFEFGTCFFIVTRYAEYGDLTSLFDQYPNIRTLENNLREIFRQTALALATLHERNIYHRDIKMMNVFAQSTKRDDFKIVLGDLGSSCIL